MNKRILRLLSMSLLPLLMAAQCGQNLPPADSTAPTSPTSLSATSQDAQVNLNWSSNQEADLEAYSIYQGLSETSLILKQTVSAKNATSEGQSEITITDLSNDTLYFFALSAVDSSGNESERSEVVSATPTANQTKPPTKFESSSPADNSENVALDKTIELSFSKPMDESSTEDAFRLESSSTLLSCDFSWNQSLTTLICKPTKELTASSNYQITVAETAKDATGKTLEEALVLTFTTGIKNSTSCTFGNPFNSCTFAN